VPVAPVMDVATRDIVPAPFTMLDDGSVVGGPVVRVPVVPGPVVPGPVIRWLAPLRAGRAAEAVVPAGRAARVETVAVIASVLGATRIPAACIRRRIALDLGVRRTRIGAERRGGVKPGSGRRRRRTIVRRAIVDSRRGRTVLALRRSGYRRPRHRTIAVLVERRTVVAALRRGRGRGRWCGCWTTLDSGRGGRVRLRPLARLERRTIFDPLLRRR
jgi:hypothetical protein